MILLLLQSLELVKEELHTLWECMEPSPPRSRPSCSAAPSTLLSPASAASPPSQGAPKQTRPVRQPRRCCYARPLLALRALLPTQPKPARAVGCRQNLKTARFGSGVSLRLLNSERLRASPLSKFEKFSPPQQGQALRVCSALSSISFS